VGDVAALEQLIESARAEAVASFGNGELLLERLVEEARHVEVQVFGDTRGGAVHLGERDCSTQRRNQKILEEAPAPGVSAELRARMGEAAVKLVREVGYVGAGTVEFLLTPDGEFHFLEMNTRLQVEHPVTEAITGLDLVEWQLRIARGEAIPLQQADIQWCGHAIEARLCAEDAFNGFAPQAGRIAAWQVPAGEGIRVDHGMVAQPTIPPYYDSMVAKVIAWGVDREQARGRLLRALAGSSVLGLVTNRDYLLQALAAPAFATPNLATRWLGEASPAWSARAPDARWAAIAAVLRLQRLARGFGPLALWSSGGLRETPLRLASGERVFDLRLSYRRGEPVETVVGEARHAIELLHDDGPQGGCDAELIVDGAHLRVRAAMHGDTGWLDADGTCAAWADLSQAPPQRDDEASHGIVTSRMHGQLVRLNVELGQRVAKGDFVLAIEAMKMEHRIEAPVAGTVVELGAVAGTQVSPGALLLRIEAEAV
jgi:geranyl-CoA carboxylase alpha subunit